MILTRSGDSIIFKSEDTPNVSSYESVYLSAEQVSDAYRLKYHNKQMMPLKKASYFKDSLGNEFNNTTMQLLIDSFEEVPYVYPRSVLYMSGNTVVTVLTNSTNPNKAAGSSSSLALTKDFVNTDNRSQYVGYDSRVFNIEIVASITCNNNRDIVGYISKNDVLIAESDSIVTADGNNNEVILHCQYKVELTYGDYIEFWVGNNTNNNNVTVRQLNTKIE